VSLVQILIRLDYLHCTVTVPALLQQPALLPHDSCHAVLCLLPWYGVSTVFPLTSTALMRFCQQVNPWLLSCWVDS
jgi:hypothetical protein